MLVCTTSANDAKEKEVMFGGSNERIAGNPRNDVSFGELFDKQVYKAQVNAARFEQLVVYAPAFRDHGKIQSV